MLSTLTMSCKDDDDDKNTSEQRNEDADPLDTDEAQTAWRWLCALTNAETLTNDWASKTYEPTVGVPSENNNNTRIVVVTSLDEAKTKFASLSGAGVSELGGELTVSQGGVGRLTWTPSKAGAQNLAEVAVDTKLIPHLQKIVYCTEDQVGVNGLFSTDVDGTAYYRLGDVVEDQDGYYWICVRPSFKQGDKGKSHWINIFNASENGKSTSGERKPMPADNVYSKYNNVAKYDNKTILLPTKLKYSREHMHNLANLVYAILHPGDYAKQVGTIVDDNHKNNGLCGFDYQYHGEKFLKKVAKYWDEKTTNGRTVWEILFNRSHEDMNKLAILYMYYQGYQWRVGRTGYLWQYEAEMDGFKPTIPDTESQEKELYNLADEGFDIRLYCSDPDSENSNLVKEENFSPQFDNGKFTYVVRYKTGEDLMKDGKYSPYEKLEGCTNIYRYNDKTGAQPHDKLETEKTIPEDKMLEQPYAGCLVGEDGNFYKSYDDCETNRTVPAAIVVYVGTTCVEKGTRYSGLAMALSDQYRGMDEQRTEEFVWAGNERSFGFCCSTSNQADKYLAIRDGITRSKAMSLGCNGTHDHPAYELAPAGLTKDVREAKGFSEWFIPSPGQWILALQGMGLTWDNNGSFTANGTDIHAKLRQFYTPSGIQDMRTSYPLGKYWVTLQGDINHAYYITFGDKTLAFADGYGDYKDKANRVRMFIAFGNDADYEAPDDGPEAKAGQVLGSNGQFYDTAEAARNDNATPTALVLYYNKDAIVEAGTGYHGLAIGLKDQKTEFNSFSMPWSTDPKYSTCATVVDDNEIEKMSTTLDGISQSNRVRNHICNANHGHPAFEVVPKNDDYLRGKGFSEWFIPSTGQWILALSQMNITWKADPDLEFLPKNGDHRKEITKLFKQAGLEDNIPESYYWTSTLASFYDDDAYTILLPYEGGSAKFDKVERASKTVAGVRAFIAF